MWRPDKKLYEGQRLSESMLNVSRTVALKLRPANTDYFSAEEGLPRKYVFIKKLVFRF